MLKKTINYRHTIHSNISKNWYNISIILISLVYLFLPNSNHMVDSLSYAGDVKYANELFSAHHLLFTYFYHLVYTGVSFIFPTIDVLRLMQFINGLFALACLVLLYNIIINSIKNSEKAKIWVLFVACSFGLMRFAVEAETYIIPIFFSLLSSRYYLKFLKNNNFKYILCCGFFASTACLFHQIHLFWGIGLFLGLLIAKKIKPIVLYLLPTPLVLIIYSIVLVNYNNQNFSITNLFRFLAEYYFTEKADIQIGFNDFFITAITFFRTFFQVHGVIIDVLKIWPIFYIVIPIVIVFVGISIFKVLKSIKFTKFEKIKNNPFEWTHFIIFILQLGFAFYSHGNSEFMVMLTFLIPFFIYLFFEFEIKALIYFSIGMFVWNISFSIYPNHHLNYQNNKALVKLIHGHPNIIFILKERNFVVNQYYYEYGIPEYFRIVDNENKKKIRTFKKEKIIIYTDILSKRVPYNRVDFTSKSNANNLSLIHHKYFIQSALGGFFIDEVNSKD